MNFRISWQYITSKYKTNFPTQMIRTDQINPISQFLRLTDFRMILFIMVTMYYILALPLEFHSVFIPYEDMRIMNK